MSGLYCVGLHNGTSECTCYSDLLVWWTITQVGSWTCHSVCSVFMTASTNGPSTRT